MFLFDTQAFIWLSDKNCSDNKLPEHIWDLFDNTKNQCLVSIASIWEIAIKLNIKKLSLAEPLHDLVKKAVQNGFEVLNLKTDHVIAVETLPRHHKDPFDRVIIAQAKLEKLKIISNDGKFDSYGITRVWG